MGGLDLVVARLARLPQGVNPSGFSVAAGQRAGAPIALVALRGIFQK